MRKNGKEYFKCCLMIQNHLNDSISCIDIFDDIKLPNDFFNKKKKP